MADCPLYHPYSMVYAECKHRNKMAEANRKTSYIWNYFSLKSDDSSKSICTLCKTVISRGKKPSEYSTKPMLNHLSVHHPKAHGDYKKLTKASKEQIGGSSNASNTTVSGIVMRGSCALSPNQPSVPDVLQKSVPWPRKHKTAALATKRLTEMLALDLQPFSVVENVGFQRFVKALAPQYRLPNRKYLADKMIPRLYTDVKTQLNAVIDNEPHLSFTVDTWTAKNTAHSYMGLTCHWLTADFTRQMAVLHCQSFVGSHNSLNIGESWNRMLSLWNITTTRCHTVISDGAANMVRTFTDVRVNRISCFVHTIQLVVKDGLLSQRAVIDACAVSRSLVSHFRHSSSATDRLSEIQQELGLPLHKLIQDVATRWSSTHQMITRLTEQRRAVTVYITECDDKKRPALPTVNQWQLLERVSVLLEQFAQLTAESCKADASISYVIPALSAVSYFLESTESDTITSGVNTMKRELLSSLQRRFAAVMTNKYYVVATAVDPRFKLQFFTEDSTVELCKAEIKIIAPKPLETQNEPSADDSETETTSPAKKVVRGYWDCFELAKRSAQNKSL